MSADIAVVAIIVLSGLIAFSLGFVRVVLALAGWVGAAFATLYGFPYLKPFARDWISIGFVADASAGAAIFILSLIVLTRLMSRFAGTALQNQAEAIAGTAAHALEEAARTDPVDQTTGVAPEQHPPMASAAAAAVRAW